jgi:hypothetical protein
VKEREIHRERKEMEFEERVGKMKELKRKDWRYLGNK